MPRFRPTNAQPTLLFYQVHFWGSIYRFGSQYYLSFESWTPTGFEAYHEEKIRRNWPPLHRVAANSWFKPGSNGLSNRHIRHYPTWSNPSPSKRNTARSSFHCSKCLTSTSINGYHFPSSHPLSLRSRLHVWVPKPHSSLHFKLWSLQFSQPVTIHICVSIYIYMYVYVLYV